MKYLSISTVVNAYNENKDRTKNKFWGLLSILSSIDVVVRPGISYNFDTSRVSTILEELFCLDNNKKLYQSTSFWNVMFSKMWATKAADLMLSKTPNIYDIASWYYRRTSFEDNASSSDMIRMLLESLHIEESDARILFDFHPKQINFSTALYDENSLRTAIKATSTNITAEGDSIVAHPGELSRAPFIQTLYAGQSLMECLIITQFQFDELYVNKKENRGIDFKTDKQYGSLIGLLQRKKNIVLTGAPGTGKTFTAKAIAASIISDGTKDWNGLSEEQKQQVGFVQFHPSYDYTDFVEGLRPVAGGSFERQDGVFKAFCKRALGETDAISDVSSNLFDKVYNELLDDIRSGVITTYERITADDRGLSVNDKNKIIFGPEAKNYKTASIRNLRLLFDYYESKGLKDVTQLTRDDLWSAISSLTDGRTNTLDYTEYRWALNQLLGRVNDSNKSLTVSSDKGLKKDISKKPYIFIIDEINRGELSKIFGELFYAIEQDYRGEAGTVQTQYNNLVDEDDIFKSGFFIPENVYIIGTMNDVDRGVEAMDFAIRRRFLWVEVTAEESAANMGITGLALTKMNALNKALIDNGLTKAHCIGGAYFRKLEGDDFDALWKYHLEGIVYEYFRGEPDADDKVNAVKDAFFTAGLNQKPSGEQESIEEESSIE